MNCASCNTPLNGSNICPNCGALNMAFNAPTPVNNPTNESAIPGVVQQEVVQTPVQPVQVVQPVQTQVPVQQVPVQQVPVQQVAAQQVVQPQVVQVPTQQVVQPQVVAMPVPEMPAVAQTPVVQEVVMPQPVGVQIQDDSAMAVNEVLAPVQSGLVIQDEVEVMPHQIDNLDIPSVDVNMPTQGDGDDSVEGNESHIIVEEDDLRVSSTMAPPTLNIQDDVPLTSGVGSINSTDVSTYSPEEMVEQANEEKKQQRREQDNINFAIPSVEQPTEQVSAEVLDGGVPDVAVDMPTQGDGDGNTEGNEVTIMSSPEDEVKERDKSTKIKKKSKGIDLSSLNLKSLKSGKSFPLPFVIIVAIVGLVLGVVVGSTLFGTQTYTKGSYNRSNINADELPRVADGKNNVTKAGAFTFTIPKDYFYDNLEGGVAIYDSKDTFRIYIRADEGSYNDLATAKTSVINTLTEQKMSVNNYKETTINKKNYVVIETTTNVVNRMIAFTDAGHDYIFYVEIVTKDNQFNHDLISVVDDLVKATKYDEKISQMEAIGVYDISEVVIKASDEYKKLEQ